MEDILIGVTDRTIPVFIPDPASTTGVGKTGLNAAAVTVTYTRYETDNDVVTTDVTSSVNDLSALTDAHNDWGWKEVSSTLSKGQYRLDVADAVFASGAWYAVVQVTITSGTASATPKAFRLVSRNDLDSVRLGLTALPNAAADAAGGLPISDAGGLDLDAKVGALTFTVANRVDSNVLNISGDATAADNLETAFDDTAGSVPWEGIIDQGTAQSATGTTLVLRSAAAFADDELNGATLVITGGSAGVGQRRLITDYVSTTDTATVSTWTTTPTGTITYKIFASAPGEGIAQTGDAYAIVNSGTHGNAALKTLIDTVDNFVDTEVADILVDTSTTLDDFVDDLETRLSAATAAKLSAHAAAVLTFAVDAGSSTTTVKFKTVEGTTASAVDDFYNGRVLVFTSGALAGQATSISDYVGATKVATVVALTGTPAEDVVGVIV